MGRTLSLDGVRAALATRMADETARTLDALEGRGEVELHDAMTRLTLTLVGRTLFDVDLSFGRLRGAEFPRTCIGLYYVNSSCIQRGRS